MADELQAIPGIGPSMAQDLRDLGIFAVGDLQGQDPELMYKRLCLIHGMDIDRCVLYVFRCAVYFASEQEHDPELLKWWNWQDGAALASRQPGE
jgi:Pathogenicity locus